MAAELAAIRAAHEIIEAELDRLLALAEGPDYVPGALYE